MRIHHATRCCIVVGLLCAAALSASAKPITMLRVQGNERIDESTIINSSMILTGDEFDTTKVAESIKKIYNLGYFSNVTAVSDTAFGGIALTLVVTEKPLIQRVEILGNKKIKTKDIEEKLPIGAESFLDRKTINDAREYIKSLYQEKGYYNVQVSDTLLESGKRAVVRLIISEGSKQRLARIRFRGNDHLPAKRIAKAMKSKPRGWTIVLKVIPWWRAGGFNPDTLKEDAGLIKRLYKNNGYIEVAAALDSLSYNAKRDRVTANFSVSEGTRYRVGDVAIKGNEKLPSKLLDKMVELKRGEVYRIDDADKSLENLYSAYTEEGYIYCNIFPEEDLRDSVVNVNYGITENQQAYIRKIVINGNTKTRDKVIRRQLLVRPGDLFRRSAVMRSQREIYSLGYFEDVRINSQKADTNGNIDLIYEVKEKQVGQFQVGVSYGQIDKLVGFTQIGWPNLMGRGQELNLKTEFSKLKFNIELGFTEPWLFDTPTSAGIDLFHTFTNYDIYDLRRTGGTLRLGRPLPWLDYTRGYWSYTLERDNLSNIQSVYQSYYANQTWPKMSSSTNFTLVRDSRDRPFNATDGTRSILSAEYAGGLLGGQVKYQKYIAEYRNYHPLFWKFVGMARARAGAVDGYTSPTTVPLDQTFFIGGVGDDGVRAEIPMLGVLGLDWAWGFDRKRLGYSDNWELHFQIGTTF